jgi:demethylmenaquinone methyltransferase/2-methoxy-6-polyprenyl-1,4-benzoquinol methylase
MILRAYRILGVDLGKWRNEAMKRLPNLKEPRILDIGVGTGSNLPFLVKEYPDYREIVGVDYTAEMLAGAKRRIRDNGWRNVELVLTDAREMSSQVHGQFDLVVSTYSLSIIPDSPSVLGEISKLLTSDGYVLFLDCQKFRGLLRVFNPLAVFLSTRLGGNAETYSVPVSELAAQMFRPVSQRLLYSGLFYEDLYQNRQTSLA